MGYCPGSWVGEVGTVIALRNLSAIVQFAEFDGAAHVKFEGPFPVLTIDDTQKKRLYFTGSKNSLRDYFLLMIRRKKKFTLLVIRIDTNSK